MIRAPLFLLPALVACQPAPSRSPPMQFTGKDAALGRAIEADDPAAVDTALAGGADANALGEGGATPLEYAVGTFRTRAAQALIRHRADPNRKDAEGDSAVTLAARAYARDPRLLAMVLDAGGDPNTRFKDGSPLIVRFGNDRNFPAMTFLRERGADVDAIDDRQALVGSYAISADWDVAWHLIQLGARVDTDAAREGLVFAFKDAAVPAPDSPLFPYKVKLWQHLKARGIDATPPAGM